MLQICALCPAGTTGDGFGCTACAAGTTTQAGDGKPVVGAKTCTKTCAAGTYSQEGSSTCLPCPMHTWSAAGKGSCTAW